eukprot:3893865-Pyramimonas_sp.AAC.1
MQWPVSVARACDGGMLDHVEPHEAVVSALSPHQRVINEEGVGGVRNLIRAGALKCCEMWMG